MTKKISIMAIVTALVSAAVPAQGLEVGDKAPPFTAESNSGRVTLDDYLGKNNVVLAFYYADFTPV